VIVSRLTTDESAELELQDEERLCGECSLRFISFLIPDRSVPFFTAEASRSQCISLVITPGSISPFGNLVGLADGENVP